MHVGRGPESRWHKPELHPLASCSLSDVKAAVGERKRNSASEAPARARHECNTVMQINHCVSFRNSGLAMTILKADLAENRERANLIPVRLLTKSQPCYTPPHESRRNRRSHCQAAAGATRPFPPLVHCIRGGPHRPMPSSSTQLRPNLAASPAARLLN